MRTVRATAFALAAIGSLIAANPPSVMAKDYFLTIGGGYGPTGNQLSLERNVIFQQAVLKEKRPDAPGHDVYFADGDDESRDVQCRDPEFKTKCPPARRIMAEVFGDSDAMDLFYRNHEVTELRGPADRSLLRRRLRALARELKAGDRLVIYVTGHGGAAENPYDDDYDYEYDEESGSWKANYSEDDDDDARAEHNEHDTSFYLWNNDSVSASEFVKWLDRFDPQAEVVLVMVQCFAGGFAHAIFHEADANLGLSSHARCGFYAQVHDRGAAGCTADANEADYEEYSSYFWGALGGRTRTGEPITTADYDGNGKVSFAEAHAYAIIESDTIDIPVRTSSALLERYSNLGKSRDEEADHDDSGGAFGRLFGALGGSKKEAEAAQQLVELSGPLTKLLPKARPEQSAIVEKLSAKLELGENPSVESLRRRIKEIDGEGKVAGAKLATARRAHTNALSRVQEEIREIWPELHATYAPVTMELTCDRADEFVERAGKLPAYEALRKAAEVQKQAAELQLKVAREEARLQRLLQACKDVVRAANLPVVAPAEIVDRYEGLVSLENGRLAP